MAGKRVRWPAVGALVICTAALVVAVTVLVSSGSAGSPDKVRAGARGLHRARPRPCPPRTALKRALAPLIRHHTGRFAIGVTDLSTGRSASYHDKASFPTASVVKADILAAVLLNAQQENEPLTDDQRALAAQMIQASDNDAATDLWDSVGGSSGMADLNKDLGLRHTVPSPSAWGLTTTTVADQLRLLRDLTSASSPLNAASRHYELSLMRSVEPDQAWGVTAAASPGTHPAVKNGWLPDDLWITNSVGVVTTGKHRLLLAALSNNQPTEPDGIHQLEKASRSAAAAMTGGVSCGTSQQS